MKKYIIATFLLPILSFAQIEIRPALKVTANYHNRSCVGGVGFCSESSSIEESKTFNATIQKKSTNQLVLNIDLKEISITELKKLRAENNFSVSGKNNLLINKELLSKLNINPLFSEIKTGLYPVLVTKDNIEITFTLSEK